MELGVRFSNTQKIIYLYITETRRMKNSFLVMQACSIFILVIDFGRIYFILLFTRYIVCAKYDKYDGELKIPLTTNF